MAWKASLFDDEALSTSSISSGEASALITKEVAPVDRLKNLEEKIATAVDRVKALKEEKISLERKIRELESLLDDKNREVESLKDEKTSIKNQVEELLEELETLEI
ncbi:MAG: cell division protein ZapB [Nitrospirae bacterium]|nr:cell division protein ZapB [Nitrospirota bacterium]